MIVVNDFQIQLSFTPRWGPDRAARRTRARTATSHFIEPAPVGDLVNGGTYEVERIDSDTVKLHNPGGGVVNLFTTDIAGTHSLRLKGVDLGTRRPIRPGDDDDRHDPRPRPRQPATHRHSTA